MNKPLMVYSSAILTQSGYGYKSRAIAQALINYNNKEYDVQFVPQRWGNCSWLDESKIDPEIISRLNKTGQFNRQPDVWIMDTVSSEFTPIGKYNVGICSGIETTVCDPSWVEGNNKMNLVLTSSKFSRDVFLNSKFEKQHPNGQKEFIESKTPIEILSESFDFKVFKKLESAKDTDLYKSLDSVEESFLFLFFGHWIHNGHSLEILGEDRKNVGLLIKIFLETFKNKKNKPGLVLKTCGASSTQLDKSEILRRIDDIRKTVVGDLPNIYLLHGDLEDEEVNELYNHPKIKSMVSLTKGEGFGRPLLEFSLTQKPIIATEWSGHLDFLKKEYTRLLPGTVTQVHPTAQVKGIIIPESGWFSVDKVAAGEALTDMFQNYKAYEVGGKRQAHYSKTEFSQEKLEQKLTEIFDKYLPKIPKFVPLQLPKTLNLPKLNKI